MQPQIIKCLFSLLFSLSLIVSNAQTPDVKDKFTTDEVAFMAVFPGCEKKDLNDKIALQACMSMEINNLLGQKIASFPEKMEKLNISIAKSKLQFVINNEGQIVEIEALAGGNKALDEASMEALTKISKKLPKIKPAKLDDGSDVNLVFQLPVKYVLQGQSLLSKMPWSEYVTYTLIDNEKKYEIRHDKNFIFRVYELNQGKYSLVRKFNSVDEIIATEPYKSLLNAQGDKALMSENKVNNILYRLYHSPKVAKGLDLYKVINDKEVFVESLHQTDIQYDMLYFQIVTRK